MKKLLILLIPLLLLAVKTGAQEQKVVQKVLLNSAFLKGGGTDFENWQKYELEMDFKSYDNKRSYTFHVGDDFPAGGGTAYIRLQIVRQIIEGDKVQSEEKILIAPTGSEDICLSPKQKTAVAYDGTQDRSFYFPLKKNTTYTIRFEWNGFWDDKYQNMTLTYYEECGAPEGVPDNKYPLLLSKDSEFNGKLCGKYSPNAFYVDLDLTDFKDEDGNPKDFTFKFYDSEDNEYIGCEYQGFREIDEYGYGKFYWASNEQGPTIEEDEKGWRNEYFTLKHSTSGISKYRINFWKADTLKTCGNARPWKLYIENRDGYVDNPDAFYFVSRELTGGARLKAFMMNPSSARERVDEATGRREVIKTLWSFHLQDFRIKEMLGEEEYNKLDAIHYHIEDAQGNTFTSHDAGNNVHYDLGFRTEQWFFPENAKTDDLGRVLRYERYDNLQGGKYLDNSIYLKNTFTLPLKEKRDKAKEAESYTWLYNSETNALSISANAPNFGLKEEGSGLYHEDSEGYSLVGNLRYKTDNVDYDKDLEVEVQNPAYSRQMRKFWYKGGKLYTYDIADADSTVYSVTISRPKEGWKKCGYVFVVFPYSAILEAREEGFGDWGGIWKKAIRPQEQWRDPKSSEGEFSGVDATALRGGLYVRREEQTDNVQQRVSVYPQETTESFTFSMNLTTSTYRFIRHSDLFIIGPAIGTATEDPEEEGWSREHPDRQTAHAYRLVYDDSEECYMYKGAEGNGNEQPVPMTAGRKFLFAYNKNFQTLVFEEDYEKPVSLIDSYGKSTEAEVYSHNKDMDYEHYVQQYDTQYTNFLRRGTSGSIAYDEDALRACTFGLPSRNGENDGYYIRLYIGQSYNNPETQQYFYTIRRDNVFSKPIDPKNPVEGYSAFKTFSDYHAVVIPDGVDAFYIEETDKANREAVLKEYPLGNGVHGERVLPAFSAVILAVKEGMTDNLETLEGTKTMGKLNIPLDCYFKPNYTEDMYEANFKKDFSGNKLKGQIECTLLPEYSSDDDGKHANFLFSYQRHHASDTQNTIGFFKAGKAKNPINSVYLQVDEDFLDGGVQSGAKGWRIVLGHGGATGVGSVTGSHAGSADGACYTLQGVKVSRPQTKSIYVRGGKKVIVK